MPFPQNYEFFEPGYGEAEEYYAGGGAGGGYVSGEQPPSWSYTQGALPYESPIPNIRTPESAYPTPYGSTSPGQFTGQPSYAGGGIPSKSTSGYTQTSKNQYERLGDKPFFIPSKNPYGTETGQGSYNYPYAQTGIPTAPGTGEFSFPELKLPTLDESRISELEQKAAGPGLRRLRQSVREVQGKYYENPNVKRMTLRDALAGYGAGIENVMTGARREAQAQYQQEFQPQVQKAQMEWQAQVQGLMAQYQNTWRDYMARLQASTGFHPSIMK